MLMYLQIYKETENIDQMYNWFYNGEKNTKNLHINSYFFCLLHALVLFR